MSFARCTARTRGVPSCARTAGAAASAPTTSETARTPRKRAAWHRCKDSISAGSPPLPANCARVTLEAPCAASCSSSRLLVAALGRSPPCMRRRARASRRSSSSASASATFEPRGTVSRFTLAGVHWRGLREGPLPNALEGRAVEPVAGWCAGGRGRPGPEVAGAAVREGGGSATRGGSASRIASRHVRSET